MWASPPGTGKSAAALNYAIQAGVPTFYISCDMRRFAVVQRVIAILTGKKISEVRNELLQKAEESHYRDVLSSVGHLYMAYPSRPDAEGLAVQLKAFLELHGAYPHLLIIDNLMNLNSGSKDEWTGLRDLSQLLHYFATELGICVLVLHHLNLGGLDLYNPAPLTAIKGQVTELPSVVLTLCKRQGQLLIAPVKNRHGKADASGRSYLTLDYDEDTQIIRDSMPAEEVPTVWNMKRDVPDWFGRGVKDD